MQRGRIELRHLEIGFTLRPGRGTRQNLIGPDQIDAPAHRPASADFEHQIVEAQAARAGVPMQYQAGLGAGERQPATIQRQRRGIVRAQVACQRAVGLRCQIDIQRQTRVRRGGDKCARVEVARRHVQGGQEMRGERPQPGLPRNGKVLPRNGKVLPRDGEALPLPVKVECNRFQCAAGSRRHL